PDGKQAVTVAEDKTVRVWDVASGKSVHVWRLPAGPGKEGVPLAAAIAPSGKLLAVGGIPYGLGENGSLIHLLDLNAGRIVQTFTGHNDAISGLAFSRDGNWLASSSIDGSGLVHSLQAGKTVPVQMVNKAKRIIKSDNTIVDHRDLFKAIAWA